MTDLEKVIKGLEHCDFGVSGTCYEKECPYYQSHDCTDELKNDILVLLKKQEAVVRCKDCKYCEYPKSEKEWCKKGHLHGNAENWFCADWERQ